MEVLIDFIGSQYAYQQALLFNNVIGIPNKLNFILPYAGSVHLLAGFKLFGLFKVSTNDDSKKFLSPNMKVAIEPYLFGKYIKFSSNSGYENPDFDAFIPAFSHFTWIQSKGTSVVLDVQGVFRDGRYYLTDQLVRVSIKNLEILIWVQWDYASLFYVINIIIFAKTGFGFLRVFREC